MALVNLIIQEHTFDKFIAVIIIFLSAVECYSGYKTLKAMRTIYGFFAGVAAGTLSGAIVKIISQSDGLAAGIGVAVALIFGVIIAVISFRFSAVGTVLFIYMAFAVFMLVLFINIKGSETGILLIILALLSGCIAAVAVIFQTRLTTIITTAVSGALLIVNATCVLMSIGPKSYPGTSVALWAILAATGIVCQLVTSKKNSQDMMSLMRINKQRDTFSFSERKYPGMQRAYRNFCIRCGHGLVKGDESCPECGFKINE